MAPPISSRFALLQALNDGPGYGLMLRERIRESSEGHVLLNRGGVYTMLKLMEDAGLVQSYEREELGPGARRGGRPMRWYEITEKGRVEFERSKKAIEGIRT